MTKNQCVNIVCNHSQFSAQQIANIYNSVGFTVPETFSERPDFPEVMYANGAFGFFAEIDGQLVGLARVFSDEVICSWIAEICVHPDWQKKKVGQRLLDAISRRFEHTAIYTEAFSGQEDFFSRSGIKRKQKLVACSKAAKKSSMS